MKSQTERFETLFTQLFTVTAVTAPVLHVLQYLERNSRLLANSVLSLFSSP